MISAVAVDLDGTLIDSLPGGSRRVQKIAQKLGWRVPSLEEIRPHWGLSTSLLIERLWPGQKIDRFQAAWRAEDEKERLSFPAFSGAHEAIRRMRNDLGKAVALYTNRTPELHLYAVLEEAGFEVERDFDLVHYPHDVIPPKPHPLSIDSLLQTCRQKELAVSPWNICVVTDQVEDAEMAMAACCKAVGVLSGASAEEKFQSRCKGSSFLALVDSIADVPDVLARP